MAKGKQGFFQSIRKYRQYLNKKKESSKIMADLRKAEDDARIKFDNLNNQMNPLQVDLKAENNSLDVLQTQLQNMNADLRRNLGIRFDPLATTAQKRLAMKEVDQLYKQIPTLEASVKAKQIKIADIQNNINKLAPNLQEAQKDFKNASKVLTYRTNYFNDFNEPSRTVRAIGYTLENPGDVAKKAAIYAGIPYGTYLWGNWSGDAPAQTPNPNTGGAAPTGTGTGNPPPPGIPPQGATEPGLPPGQGNIGVATGTTPPPNVQNSGETIPMHHTNAFNDALRAKLARDRIKAYQESKQ